METIEYKAEFVRIGNKGITSSQTVVATSLCGIVNACHKMTKLGYKCIPKVVNHLGKRV